MCLIERLFACWPPTENSPELKKSISCCPLNGALHEKSVKLAAESIYCFNWRGEGEMLEALRVLFGLYPHKRGALNQV